MRFEPTIEVNCDKCGDVVYWSPEYVYNNWSGTSGYYDTSDAAFDKWKRSEGWEGVDDNDVCDSCAAVDREE